MIEAILNTWIERFGAEYVQRVKKSGCSASSLTLEENEDIVFISIDFEVEHKYKYFIIAQRKSDRHILVVDILAFDLAFDLALTFAFACPFAHVDYYKARGWLHELASIEHFNVAMMASDNLEEFYALCKAMDVK